MKVIEFADINANTIGRSICVGKDPEIGDEIIFEENQYKVTGVHDNRKYNKLIVVIDPLVV